MNNPAGDKPVICVVMPVFNDWAAMPRLLANLADAFRPSGSVLDIILVNDASTKPDNFAIEQCTADDVITGITILDLSVNVGHQLAITAGLHYAQRHRPLPRFWSWMPMARISRTMPPDWSPHRSANQTASSSHGARSARNR